MKVLIIRFSSIGDIVLTTPIIRNLQQQLPKITIHYLCKENFISVLADHPAIELLHGYPHQRFEREGGVFAHLAFRISRRKKRQALKKKLLAERYDWVVDLHNNLRSRLWTYILQTHGESQVLWVSRLAKYRWKRWLYCNFKLGDYPRKETHIVDRILHALQATRKIRKLSIGCCRINEGADADALTSASDSFPCAHLGLRIRNDRKGLDFFFPEDFSASTESNLLQIELLEKLLRKKRTAEFGKLQGTAFLVWILGGSYETKKYPFDQMTQCLERICVHLPVVLVGGLPEQEMSEKLAKLDSRNIINLCNRLSLAGSAKVLEKARLVISHDTGLMHIAVALKKEVIAIYGNTSPIFGLAPYYGEEFLEQYKKQSSSRMGPNTPYQIMETDLADVPCRPCSHLGYGACPKKHFQCMRGIAPYRIVQAVLAYLATDASAS